MGLGIGGDYPLSAVISSEFASTKIRGRMMTAVFAAQGWGNFGESHLFPNTLPYILESQFPFDLSCRTCRFLCHCFLQEFPQG